MEFSSNLRYLRRKNGLSQDELANKLGYKSFTTIQKWESGVSEPSVSTLKIIADIFSVSMDQMINDDLSAFSQSSSSAPELKLTEQQEELIKLSNNLSEEQVARILSYAQAIYDLQSDNQHPAVSISKAGEKNAAEEAEREVNRIVAKELAAAKKSIAK